MPVLGVVSLLCLQWSVLVTSEESCEGGCHVGTQAGGNPSGDFAFVQARVSYVKKRSDAAGAQGLVGQDCSEYACPEGYVANESSLDGKCCQLDVTIEVVAGARFPAAGCDPSTVAPLFAVGGGCNAESGPPILEKNGPLGDAAWECGGHGGNHDMRRSWAVCSGLKPVVKSASGGDWVTVKCDEGQKILSGGCRAHAPPHIFQKNSPEGEDGWTCGGHGGQKKVWALCSSQIKPTLVKSRGGDWHNAVCAPGMKAIGGGCDAYDSPHKSQMVAPHGDDAWRCGGHGGHKEVSVICVPASADATSEKLQATTTTTTAACSAFGQESCPSHRCFLTAGNECKGFNGCSRCHDLRSGGACGVFREDTSKCVNAEESHYCSKQESRYEQCLPEAPCDASAAPSNGGAGTCTDVLESGRTCRPSCDEGYAASGDSTCSEGSFAPARCLAPCDVVAPDHGGVGDCPARLVSSGTCQPTCDTLYKVTGPNSCSDGTLTAARCLAPCDAEAPVDGSLGRCPARLVSGATCVPACDEGFAVVGVSRCDDGKLTAATCQRTTTTTTTNGKIALSKQCTFEYFKTAVNWCEAEVIKNPDLYLSTALVTARNSTGALELMRQRAGRGAAGLEGQTSMRVDDAMDGKAGESKSTKMAEEISLEDWGKNWKQEKDMNGDVCLSHLGPYLTKCYRCPISVLMDDVVKRKGDTEEFDQCTAAALKQKEQDNARAKIATMRANAQAAVTALGSVANRMARGLVNCGFELCAPGILAKSKACWEGAKGSRHDSDRPLPYDVRKVLNSFAQEEGHLTCMLRHLDVPSGDCVSASSSSCAQRPSQCSEADFNSPIDKDVLSPLDYHKIKYLFEALDFARLDLCRKGEYWSCLAESCIKSGPR